MAFTQPAPFGVFVNFTAANRKPLLVPSGYFSPSQSVAFIWSVPTGGGQQVTLQGTIDGVNRIFTSPVTVTGIFVYRNGVLLDPASPYSAYTVSGNTVTFANAPEVGDDLNAIVS